MDWTGLVSQLIELVESTAPTLWAIAQRQVVADTVEMAFWTLVFGVAAVLCWKLGRKWRVELEECDESEEELYCWGIVAAYALVVISVPIAFMIAAGAIKRLVSPDYYALKLLISMATGGN